DRARRALLPRRPAAAPRLADAARRYCQNPDLTGLDRAAGILHGDAVPAGIVAPRRAQPRPRALGLGCQRLRLGAERHPRDPSRDELWLPRRRADRPRALRPRRSDIFYFIRSRD